MEGRFLPGAMEPSHPLILEPTESSYQADWGQSLVSTVNLLRTEIRMSHIRICCALDDTFVKHTMMPVITVMEFIQGGTVEI